MVEREPEREPEYSVNMEANISVSDKNDKINKKTNNT
jgi:hypothetical protein